MSSHVESITYSTGYSYCSVNLPALTNHLVGFSDNVVSIINETHRLVYLVKGNSDIRRMYDVTHALSEVNCFVVKGYEYINRINDIPYYFQCQFDNEWQMSDYQNCISRFNKGCKSLKESEVIYETLRSYCRDAQRSCDAAADKLQREAESARKKRLLLEPLVPL